ncbi:hypothetical protein BJX63DRAFT_402371 [Aspergillus granulosus]|uniref:Uncharacterized protein n=1 Tax=Aspergillus granulosus TaxID=176169 RepID=A0ABR4H680_9EURO
MNVRLCELIRVFRSSTCFQASTTSTRSFSALVYLLLPSGQVSIFYLHLICHSLYSSSLPLTGIKRGVELLVGITIIREDIVSISSAIHEVKKSRLSQEGGGACSNLQLIETKIPLA